MLEEDFTKEQQSTLQESFWECQCECGSIITVSGSALKNNHTISCGCIKSKGEEAIANILNNLHITFEREKIFNTCKAINNVFYRFDFYLPKYNIIIEYDGRQHFLINSG